MTSVDSLTVLQLLPALEQGGVERGTLEVAQGLVDAGHRALVASAGGVLVRPLQDCGARHVCMPVGEKSLLTLRLIGRLRRLLIDEQVDVLHARSRVPAWLAVLALRGIAAAQRPRFITTAHGFYSVSRYSAVMTKGERVIAVSQAISDYLVENYPALDPERISLIHRGIDRAVFPYGFSPGQEWMSRWRAQYPQLVAKQVLCLPGRITRLKGHHAFLDLLKAMIAMGSKVHGLIVGGDDPRRKAYAKELRSRCTQMGLDEHVTFTDRRADVREIMAVSDVVLSLSSKPESFGRTVLEALSLGTPVIGFDHGGVGEILRRVFPQGTVAVGDVDAAASLCAKWRTQPPVVNAQHPFELATMLANTLAVYHQVCARSTE